MKALIVKKKWLDLILSGEKTWEMRSSPTKVRGTIALIESGSGEIKGTVNIVASPKIRYSKESRFIKYHQIQDLELLDKWPYVWVLSGAKRLKKPVKYKHPQGAVIWVNDIEGRLIFEGLLG